MRLNALYLRVPHWGTTQTYYVVTTAAGPRKIVLPWPHYMQEIPAGNSEHGRRRSHSSQSLSSPTLAAFTCQLDVLRTRYTSQPDQPLRHFSPQPPKSRTQPDSLAFLPPVLPCKSRRAREIQILKLLPPHPSVCRHFLTSVAGCFW